MPSSSASRTASWPLVYLAVALTTAATLLLELSLSRIFSVVFEYPSAFLAMTIALCGAGVGGMLSYRVVPETEGASLALGKISLLNAGIAMASVMAVTWRGAGMGAWEVGIACVVSTLPFVGSGMILVITLADAVERVDRVYGFGLLGAAAACLGAVGLMNTVGAPNAAISVSVLFAAAAAIWFSLGGRRLGRVVSVGVGLYFTLLVIANVGAHFVDVQYAKGRALPAERFSKWNRVSRVGVGMDGGLSVDGVAIGGIANGDVEPGHAGTKTLVIGAEGGLAVAQALAAGSRDVTVVERNPILANTVMRGRFAELSGRLYLRPDVHVQVDEGRSFLRRTAEKYQVIRVNLTAAGAWTEGAVLPFEGARLCTVEAFRDYFSHLTADGVVVLTGWETSQTSEAAMSALRGLGETNPGLHFHMVGGKTMVIGRHPSSRIDLGIPTFREAESALARGTGKPATDDHPFVRNMPYGLAAVIAGGAALLTIVGLGLALTGTRGGVGFLPYFLLIGTACELVEFALVQKFVLILGRPTYALTTVTFALFLAGAAGAFSSRKLLRDSMVRMRVALGAAGAVVGVMAIAQPLPAGSEGLPLALRIVLAGLLVATAGFAMGLLFPAGFRLLGRTHDAQLRWAWSMHAVAGVLGSVGALALAVNFGITVTLLAGASCYLVALVFSRTRVVV